MPAACRTITASRAATRNATADHNLACGDSRRRAHAAAAPPIAMQLRPACDTAPAAATAQLALSRCSSQPASQVSRPPCSATPITLVRLGRNRFNYRIFFLGRGSWLLALAMPKATAIGALGALLAAAVVVSHLVVPRPGTSWAVLLQQGAAGWSRPPSVTPLSRLWQKAPRDESGWGRLPQRHKPRVRHALPAPPAQHTRLSRELPSVYHLPAAQHPYAQVPAADRRAAQMLARNLARAHTDTVSGPHERPGQRARRRVSAARLRREERSLPPGYHVLQPGQRLPRGAKLVKALPLPAGNCCPGLSTW